jgi:hypothetical protein
MSWDVDFKVVEFIYLQAGERPPPDKEWLLIIKAHNQDYELIVSRGVEATTLGTDASLQDAQTRATAASKSLGIGTIYVLGAPNA